MSQMPLISVHDNRFYAGMTIDEARKNGTDKSWWRRDFQNVDKDRNGRLSVDEIINERNNSSKCNKIAALLMVPLGIFDASLNLKDSSKLWLMIDLAIDAFLIFACLNKAMKTDKQTQNYEEIIKANNINRYA